MPELSTICLIAACFGFAYGTVKLIEDIANSIIATIWVGSGRADAELAEDPEAAEAAQDPPMIAIEDYYYLIASIIYLLFYAFRANPV